MSEEKSKPMYVVPKESMDKLFAILNEMPIKFAPNIIPLLRELEQCQLVYPKIINDGHENKDGDQQEVPNAPDSGNLKRV